MKAVFSLAISLLIVSAISVCAADAAANWSQHCVSCHGKDGSGATTMGKKLGVKDYTKTQSFSDADATKAIKDGSGKMKGFKDKLSDGDVKALVAYVRGLKK
jgi:mono/diheme cytochrome c family protein